MQNFIKNMVRKSGIRFTLNYLITHNFSDEELIELENFHILNMGIPSVSLLYSFKN